jgi:hypothetical protein
MGVAVLGEELPPKATLIEQMPDGAAPCQQ